MIKLTYESDEMTYSIKKDRNVDDTDTSDQAWLFGEMLRVCHVARLDQVVAEVIMNLDEDFGHGANPEIDDARDRMVRAAFDLTHAWDRLDDEMDRRRAARETPQPESPGGGEGGGDG